MPFTLNFVFFVLVQIDGDDVGATVVGVVVGVTDGNVVGNVEGVIVGTMHRPHWGQASFARTPSLLRSKRHDTERMTISSGSKASHGTSYLSINHGVPVSMQSGCLVGELVGTSDWEGAMVDVGSIKLFFKSGWTMNNPSYMLLITTNPLSKNGYTDHAP